MATSKADKVRKLLGQSFYIGFEGVEVPNDVAKFIVDNHIGGVTLFANNYESPAQIAELTNALQVLSSQQKDNDYPMTIAVDHEGGKVQRFKKPFTKFPPACVIGKQNSAKLAFDYGNIQGQELKVVGVNTVFAPVADINTNPKNPVIGERSFGDTEERVSKIVSAVVRGYLTNKVQPVVKHFPGHGDTNTDSHFKLPKVSTPLKTLMEREFRPFVKAFKGGCQMVMSAHIIVEAIDPKLPATLCEKIITDILRKELRYSGIVFTDDMEMKAIADNFGEVDAAIMALEAGCDILLYHTMPFIHKVFEPLLEKLCSPEGKKALKNLELANERIRAFKKEKFLPYTPVYIPEISHVVGTKENLALAEELTKYA